MPHNKFRELDYDALIELHLIAVNALLESLDKAGNEGETNAKRKQVELIYTALVERRTKERPGSGVVRP